jgi:hypothetical protein
MKLHLSPSENHRFLMSELIAGKPRSGLQDNEDLGALDAVERVPITPVDL